MNFGAALSPHGTINSLVRTGRPRQKTPGICCLCFLNPPKNNTALGFRQYALAFGPTRPRRPLSPSLLCCAPMSPRSPRYQLVPGDRYNITLGVLAAFALAGCKDLPPRWTHRWPRAEREAKVFSSLCVASLCVASLCVPSRCVPSLSQRAARRGGGRQQPEGIAVPCRSPPGVPVLIMATKRLESRRILDRRL